MGLKLAEILTNVVSQHDGKICSRMIIISRGGKKWNNNRKLFS